MTRSGLLGAAWCLVEPKRCLLVGVVPRGPMTRYIGTVSRRLRCLRFLSGLSTLESRVLSSGVLTFGTG